MLWFLGSVFAFSSDIYLDMNLPRLARQRALEELTEDPDNQNAHALLAISLCRMGQYADALPHFDFAQDSLQFPVRFHEYHAQALRYTHQPMKAYGIRSELMMDSRVPVGMHPRILAEMIDDARQAQRLDLAYATAYRLVADFPSASLGVMMLAELALDIGDTDEAEMLLDQAYMRRKHPRTKEVYARYLFLTGKSEEAITMLRYHAHSHTRVLELYAQLSLQVYGEKKTLMLFQRIPFLFHMSEKLLEIQLHCHNRQGDTTTVEALHSYRQMLYGERNPVTD